MASLSDLRRKNAAAAPAKDGTKGVPAFLPEVQTGKHHQRAKFQSRNYPSAGRKDAVLTVFIRSCTASFLYWNLLKSLKSFLALDSA